MERMDMTIRQAKGSLRRDAKEAARTSSRPAPMP